MTAFDITALVEAFKKTEAFSEEQIGLLEEADSDLQMWTIEEYKGIGFNPAEAIVARQTVRDTLGVIRPSDAVIPETPPYLKDVGYPPVFGKTTDDGGKTIKKTASVGGYDPHDPLQFCIVGDQKFRWDGKRSERFLVGERHEIAIVEHNIVNGLLVPDMEQARKVELEGKQWFHRGYNCWISIDGKPLSRVPREKLSEMRTVVERTTALRVA
ncbi:hypothetical protein LCGC14_2430250 [marine sediment metagenome]|uniref:Uncharacterized protein n=1 Tax=marine sediment metagenome TaxID=412755 RepID=A0A0F9EG48_9ZZZZ